MIFTNSKIFSGVAAQAMGAYLTEVHGAILGAWQNVMAYYQELIERYIRDLQAIDPNTDAIIDLDYLDNYADAVYPVVNEYYNLSEDISHFVKTLRELPTMFFSSEALNTPGHIADDLSQTRNPTEDQRFAMGNLDYNFQDSLADVMRMLSGIQQVSQQNLLGNNSIIFRPGSFRSGPFYQQIGISQNMKDNMAKRYFDANGNLDHFRVGFTIFTGHEHGLSDLELQVLLQTFNNQPDSVDAILKSYEMAYFIAIASRDHALLNGFGLTASINDDFKSFLIEASTSGGFVRTLYSDTDNKVLHQLANAFTNSLMSEAERILMNAGMQTTDERDNLMVLLQNAQFATFLSEIGLSASASDFDLSNFGGQNGGHITFKGQNFQASGVYSLLGHRYGSEGILANIANLQAELDEMRNNLNNSTNLQNALSLLASMGITASGYIPHVGSFISIPISSNKYINTIINMLSSGGVDLTPQEREILERMLALGVFDVGGGIASIQTPNGYRVVGTTLTRPDAVINLAGIYHTFGISPEAALVIFRDPNAPRDLREKLESFTGGSNEAHEEFVYKLTTAFRDNLDRINTRFRLSLTENTALTSLSSEVLEYVLSLVG